MTMRRRHLWTTALPILGLTVALQGCGAEILITSALSVVGPPIVDAAVAAITGKDADSVDIIAVADRLQAKGDHAQAAALYQRAHEADPEDVEALAGLAESLTAIGDNRGASEAYARALALEPEDPALLRGLGNTRILLAQPQFAVPQFEAALAADRRDVRSYNGLGVALDMTGDHQAAQKAYRAGLAIEPANQTLLNNLGLSLALVGKEAEAVAMLEKVNAAPAATAVNRQNLALVYGLSGQYEAAERLASVDLDNSSVQQNLSYYVANQGSEPGPALASALGVELRGLQYARVTPPTSTPAIDDNSRMLASAPAAEEPEIAGNPDLAARSPEDEWVPIETVPDSPSTMGDDDDLPPPDAAPREPVYPSDLAELPGAAEEPLPLPPSPPREPEYLAQLPPAPPEPLLSPPSKPRAGAVELASVPPAMPEQRRAEPAAAVPSVPQTAPELATDEVDLIEGLSPIRADTIPLDEAEEAPSAPDTDQSAAAPAPATMPQIAPTHPWQLAFAQPASRGGFYLPEPFSLESSDVPTVTRAMGGAHPAVLVDFDILGCASCVSYLGAVEG